MRDSGDDDTRSSVSATGVHPTTMSVSHTPNETRKP